MNGAKELKLVTDNGENLNGDSFGWGDARLTNIEPPKPVEEVEIEYTYTDSYDVTLDVPEGAVYVSDLTMKSWIMYESISSNPDDPYKPSINSDEGGGALVIGGDEFEHGLRTHVDKKYCTYAEFVYDISEYKGSVNKFQAVVGKASKGGTMGAVDFVILIDDGSGVEYVPLEGDDHLVEVGRSHPVDAGFSSMIYADITNASLLVLRVYDGGDGISNDSAAFGNPVIYAAKGGYTKLDKTEYVPEESLEVTINLPASYEPNKADWIGVYKASANENMISSADSLGIWCYIGTNTKTYGVPEGTTLTLTIDSSLSENSPSEGVPKWPLEPGEYKVLLFFNDSYTVEDSAKFTVVEDTPAVTPTTEPTTAPTNEPTPNPTDAPTPKPTDEPKDDNGCGNVITSGIAAVVIAVIGAAVVLKKKED